MRQRFYVRQPQPHQIRQMQWTRPRDVSQGVAAHVAVLSGIRQFPDAHRIQDNPNNPLEFHHKGCPAKINLP